jgi:hypothetical protein
MTIQSIAQSITLIAFFVIPTYIKHIFTVSIQKPLQKIQCEINGKEFLTWCYGEYGCIQKFSDAGAQCSSSNLHCQGFCIATGNDQGVCSAYPRPIQDYDKYEKASPQQHLEPSRPPDTPPQIILRNPCTIR